MKKQGKKEKDKRIQNSLSNSLFFSLRKRGIEGGSLAGDQYYVQLQKINTIMSKHHFGRHSEKCKLPLHREKGEILSK